MADEGEGWSRFQPIEFTAATSGPRRMVDVADAKVVLAALDSEAGLALLTLLHHHVLAAPPMHPLSMQGDQYAFQSAYDAGRRSLVIELGEMIAAAKNTLFARNGT